jgi:hypothetical protein
LRFSIFRNFDLSIFDRNRHMPASGHGHLCKIGGRLHRQTPPAVEIGALCKLGLPSHRPL